MHCKHCHADERWFVFSLLNYELTPRLISSYFFVVVCELRPFEEFLRKRNDWNSIMCSFTYMLFSLSILTVLITVLFIVISLIACVCWVLYKIKYFKKKTTSVINELETDDREKTLKIIQLLKENVHQFYSYKLKSLADVNCE